ncbi:hypothetical protein [Streptomyces sp. NPDC051662]|uniref:hypothetical protein n=1 Tax=Streptomyces sp. NPDC051662 TaxID=3154750 RepID=UPI00341D4B0E
MKKTTEADLLLRKSKVVRAMGAVLDGEVPALWGYARDRFSRKGAEAVVPILAAKPE